MNTSDKAALVIAYIEYRETEMTISDYAEKYEYSDIEDAIATLIYVKGLYENGYSEFSVSYLEWLADLICNTPLFNNSKEFVKAYKQWISGTGVWKPIEINLFKKYYNQLGG
jgi:hypothetical protein